MDFLDDIEIISPSTHQYKDNMDIEYYELLIFYDVVSKIISLYDKYFVEYYNEYKSFELQQILDGYITEKLKLYDGFFIKFKNDSDYIYFDDILYYVINYYFQDENKRNHYELEYNIFKCKLRSKYCRTNGLNYFYYSRY